MSLAFSANETISALPSTRSKTMRKTVLDLAFVVPFVVLAMISIVVVATQPTIPAAEQAMTGFAGL